MVGRVRVGAEGRHRAVQRAWAQSVCSNPRAGPKELGRELGETPLLSREFGYDFKRERFLTAREKEALADQPWDAYNVPDPRPTNGSSAFSLTWARDFCGPTATDSGPTTATPTPANA